MADNTFGNENERRTPGEWMAAPYADDDPSSQGLPTETPPAATPKRLPHGAKLGAGIDLCAGLVVVAGIGGAWLGSGSGGLGERLLAGLSLLSIVELAMALCFILFALRILGRSNYADSFDNWYFAVFGAALAVVGVGLQAHFTPTKLPQTLSSAVGIGYCVALAGFLLGLVGDLVIVLIVRPRMTLGDLMGEGYVKSGVDLREPTQAAMYPFWDRRMWRLWRTQGVWGRFGWFSRPPEDIPSD